MGPLPRYFTGGFSPGFKSGSLLGEGVWDVSSEGLFDPLDHFLGTTTFHPSEYAGSLSGAKRSQVAGC